MEVTTRKTGKVGILVDFEINSDGIIVNYVYRVDIRRLFGGDDQVPAPFDILGIEIRAVMELDVFAEMKDDSGGFHINIPGSGQFGDHGSIFLDIEHGFQSRTGQIH